MASSSAEKEIKRRKKAVAQGQTDIERWQDNSNLEAGWEARAVVAADFIPVGATLYDFGCGAMHLERYLPRGARYIPCDLVKRDERTLLCDFNQGTFPTVEQADCLTVLGVLEYIYDVAAFLKQLRTYNCSVVMSYNPAELTGHLDRPALGWVNHLSYEELVKACSDAGFSVFAKQAIEPNQLIFKLVPKDMPPILCQKILVLSYNNIGNFGDRLGFHLLQDILPPHAQVTHAHYKPWDMPAEPYDLLILGTGHSIYDETISDNLLKLVEQTPKVIGIFGTQYRHDIHPTRLNALLDRLTVWFARYEEDILLYGKNRDNVHHLGDWLMHYFPLMQWTDPRTLNIGPEIKDQDMPLDRMIQTIQRHRMVQSARVHPLLCALPSAEKVAYIEQREYPNSSEPSGKFRSMLMDVFGRTFPENQFFDVDRYAVATYKAKVEQSISTLKDTVERLLTS